MQFVWEVAAAENPDCDDAAAVLYPDILVDHTIGILDYRDDLGDNHGFIGCNCDGLGDHSVVESFLHCDVDCGIEDAIFHLP